MHNSFQTCMTRKSLTKAYENISKVMHVRAEQPFAPFLHKISYPTRTHSHVLCNTNVKPRVSFMNSYIPFVLMTVINPHRAIVSHFLGTQDVPTCLFWEDLLRAYPSAKVILTVRDADAWCKSCEDTIFCTAPGNPNIWWGK